MNQDFLSIDRVAARYDTSKHSIYRWMREELAFPLPIKLPSGVKRWRTADLLAWEATRGVTADEIA
ncbi:AlpA family phage regulatory protein [Sphingomonas sp. ABOLF]|uniref:helix-turn-helix transcriptional regulator n=1 Tax=Sphingomonas sp. ABOLF TaxID=1985879 RepID=UPI000F7ED211|nr:AlpA family phage regulatory protein [Sphingomonas sp. ABOLF]RSV17502.1 AlpA family phage regulatory protein [Sphingomonas sp. ABOLF]